MKLYISKLLALVVIGILAPLWWTVLVTVHSATAGSVYRWVDSSGTVHYGDKPPQGKSVKEINAGPPSPQPQSVNEEPASAAKPRDSAIKSEDAARTEANRKLEEAKIRSEEAKKRAVTAKERAPDSSTTKYRTINGCPIKQGTQCTNPDFRNEDLTEAYLVNAVLINANFAGANLTKTDFRNAQLVNANFTGAYFRKTNLGSANLSGSDLRGIRIEETRFQFVNLQSANLSYVDFSGVDMRFADLRWTIQNGTIMVGTDLRRAKQTINGCELAKNAKCPGVKLSGANLREAELDGVELPGADLTGANLKQAQLGGSNLSSANLTGADLSGANLDEANLSKATLDKATLLGTSFRGANLSSAKLRNLPRVYQLGFNNTNLENADFANSDLQGVGFRTCNLKNTRFDGADLTRANLTGSDTRKVQFGTANISSCKGCILDEQQMEKLKKSAGMIRRILGLSQGTSTDLPKNVQAVIELFDTENKLGVHVAGKPLYIGATKGPWGSGNRTATELALSDDSNAMYVFYGRQLADQETKCDRLVVSITSSIICPDSPVCLTARVPGSVKHCAVNTDYNIRYSGYETTVHCENGYVASYVENGIKQKSPPRVDGSDVDDAGCYPQAAPAMPASPPGRR